MSSETLERVMKSQKFQDTHLMEIDGFSKLTSSHVLCCQSSVFENHGYKWKLIVYPNGKDGKSDHISVYLRIKDKASLGPNWEVLCNFDLMSFRLADATRIHCFRVTETRRYNASEAIMGVDNCISSHVLNRYLLNDKLVLGIRIRPESPSSLNNTRQFAERVIISEIPKNNSKFTWKIAQFSSFDAQNHTSYEFTVGPRRWRLVMFPKGNKDGKGNSLSLFLAASDYVKEDGPKPKTLAVFKLRVLDQLYRKHYESGVIGEWFGGPGDVKATRGENKFMPLKKLNDPNNGYLVRDEIYLGVEFLLVSSTEYL